MAKISLKSVLAAAVAAFLLFGLGVLYSRPDHIAPNAVFYIPSDTGEYLLAVEAELVVVSDTGRRIARYQKDDVLPALGKLAGGRSISYEDRYGYSHYFDGKVAQRKIQNILRKALFGM